MTLYMYYEIQKKEKKKLNIPKSATTSVLNTTTSVFNTTN